MYDKLRYQITGRLSLFRIPAYYEGGFYYEEFIPL